VAPLMHRAAAWSTTRGRARVLAEEQKSAEQAKTAYEVGGGRRSCQHALSSSNVRLDAVRELAYRSRTHERMVVCGFRTNKRHRQSFMVAGIEAAMPVHERTSIVERRRCHDPLI
jgi:hypothetical protein